MLPTNSPSRNPVPLSQHSLSHIKLPVSTPKYAKGDLKPGIVHFGLGNFHRAHQALYLHRLFDQGKNLDWAVVGAGVLLTEHPLYEALKRQDFLYTLIEQSAADSHATIVGSLSDYLPPADFEEILRVLSSPHIRIVSLTVTEGGYYRNEQTGQFDAAHPSIVADATNALPRTVFGLIAAALRERRATALAPFTVMSCDNIPHNGAVAREAVLGLTNLSDPELSRWINDNVAFPNSMVDRITPVTADRERKSVRDDWGIVDDAPVFCERFSQWVLEDHFPAGRPALQSVGVQFAEDVSPFETMKIRILNGGHATIAYPAGLLDIEFAYQAMQNPLIKAFLLKVENTEIIPVVPPVPETDLHEYFSQVCERFSNPKIDDTVRRLCLDGSNRQPKFILPSIHDRIATGGNADGLALVSALWCRYCYGVSELGTTIEPNDPNWDALTLAARQARDSPKEWLSQERVYGTLSEKEDFVDAFCRWLHMIWRDGTVATLDYFVRQ